MLSVDECRKCIMYFLNGLPPEDLNKVRRMLAAQHASYLGDLHVNALVEELMHPQLNFASIGLRVMADVMLHCEAPENVITDTILYITKE